MTVFNTPQPNFSIGMVERFIDAQYGFSVKAKALTSERDQNFLCTQEKNNYILKISNPYEDKTILEMQNSCIQYISGRDPSISIPSIIPGLNDEPIQSIQKENDTFFVRLLNYVPGQFLKDIHHQHNLLYKLGIFLGRLTNAMDGFDHAAAHRKFEWNIENLDFIIDHNHFLESKIEIVKHFTEQYVDNILPVSSGLRKAVIHNDGNDHNVLVNNLGKPSGIIDFGDMVYTYVVCEPAVCMAYVAAENREPLDLISQVLKGFHNEHPLVEEELLAAIYLVCMRLCITVTMAAYRKQLFPQNKYISVTENQAWVFLEKMKNQDLKDWSKRLAEYAQS